MLKVEDAEHETVLKRVWLDDDGPKPKVGLPPDLEAVLEETINGNRPGALQPPKVRTGSRG